jgi:hypothetical protein
VPGSATHEGDQIIATPASSGIATDRTRGPPVPTIRSGVGGEIPRLHTTTPRGRALFRRWQDLSPTPAESCATRLWSRASTDCRGCRSEVATRVIGTDARAVDGATGEVDSYATTERRYGRAMALQIDDAHGSPMERREGGPILEIAHPEVEIHAVTLASKGHSPVTTGCGLGMCDCL